jgi:flavorubredoxin
MNVAIRYQSRGGYVREMAEIISEGVNVEPISIDDDRAPITRLVDVLFIGGALYKFRRDSSLVDYISNIDRSKVRRAIVFGSSALTRRPVYLIQEMLEKRGIEVHPMAMYMRGKPKPYLHEIGPTWAEHEVRMLEKEFYGDDVERVPEAIEAPDATGEIKVWE